MNKAQQFQLGPWCLEFAVASDVGLKRPENQDAYACVCNGHGALLLVADGMGGLHNGALASALTAHIFGSIVAERKFSAQSLRDGVTVSNQVIHSFAERTKSPGMGSTLVGLAVAAEKSWIVSVGDSRAYLLRDELLKQLTTDHTVLAELRASALVGEDEGHNSPAAHMLTRSLGTKPKTEMDILEQGLCPGDVFLLCSDGLYNMVSDQQLKELMKEPPQAAIEQLLSKANAAGGHDNITALLVRVGSAAGHTSAIEPLVLYAPQIEAYSKEIVACELEILPLVKSSVGLDGPNWRLLAEGLAIGLLMFAGLFADHWLPGVLSNLIQQSIQRELLIEPDSSQDGKNLQQERPARVTPEKHPDLSPQASKEMLNQIAVILKNDRPGMVMDEQVGVLAELTEGSSFGDEISPELKKSLLRYLELARLYQQSIKNWRKKPRDVASGERVGSIRRELNAERSVILRLTTP